MALSCKESVIDMEDTLDILEILSGDDESRRGMDVFIRKKGTPRDMDIKTIEWIVALSKHYGVQDEICFYLNLCNGAHVKMHEYTIFHELNAERQTPKRKFNWGDDVGFLRALVSNLEVEVSFTLEGDDEYAYVIVNNGLDIAVEQIFDGGG